MKEVQAHIIHTLFVYNISAFSMMDLYYLTRQILRYRLERAPDLGEERALIEKFLEYGTIYVVADPNTSAEEWHNKTFGIATQERALCLYIDREDALLHARTIQSLLPGGVYMVIKTTKAMAKSLVANYSRKDFIDGVWLCGKAPVCARVGVAAFFQNVNRESPSTIMSTDLPPHPAAPEPDGEEPSSHVFELVAEVREVLNTPARADRRKIDRSDYYTNFHTLLDKLLLANGLGSSTMDEALGLNPGFTEMQRREVTKSNIPKDIMLKYLDFFGLREFLYVFKEQSLELAKELRDTPDMDKYEIKKAGAKTIEAFTLIKVESKKVDGINRYRMLYKSDHRTVSSVESSIFDRIKGGKYQINGLDPVDTGLQGRLAENENASTQAADAVPQDAIENILKQLDSKDKHGCVPRQPKQGRGDAKPCRGESMTPDAQMERDRSTVLGWICQTKKVSSAEAKNMMAKFSDNSTVLASFAKYISTKKADTSYARFGYTPRRLMTELHFDIIEAYEIMAAFESDPKGTKQYLKYRETDPQYQKPKHPPKS